jgi:hypothetical protein
MLPMILEKMVCEMALSMIWKAPARVIVDAHEMPTPMVNRQVCPSSSESLQVLAQLLS